MPKKNISKPFSATYPDRGHHTSSCRRGCIRQKVFRAGWAQRLFRVLCVDGHVPGGLCRQRSTLLSRVGKAGETGCQIKKRRKGESQELKERGYIVLEENVLQVLEYIHHSRLRRRNRSEDEILSSHLPYFVLNEQNRGRKRRRALTKSAMAMNSTLIPPPPLFFL